jgi:hypothetical protein
MRRVVKPGRPKKKEVQKERVYNNWKQTASDLAIELELVKQDNDELYSEINKLANHIARLSFEFAPNCVESSKFALGNLKTLLEKTGIVTLQDLEYAETCTERLIVAKVHESFNQFYHDRGIED